MTPEISWYLLNINLFDWVCLRMYWLTKLDVVQFVILSTANVSGLLHIYMTLGGARGSWSGCCQKVCNSMSTALNLWQSTHKTGERSSWRTGFLLISALQLEKRDGGGGGGAAAAARSATPSFLTTKTDGRRLFIFAAKSLRWLMQLTLVIDT